jgi:hypothetical protein
LRYDSGYDSRSEAMESAMIGTKHDCSRASPRKMRGKLPTISRRIWIGRVPAGSATFSFTSPYFPPITKSAALSGAEQPGTSVTE